MPCPLPLHPLIPVKVTPTAPGNRAGLGWNEPHSVGFQRGTPLNPPSCRGNLPAYPASAPPRPVTGYEALLALCGSRARPDSILLTLVGIGLMPRWGQGAGPQSKRCGYCCRKVASCFLFTCPPTRRVPFERSLPHCIFLQVFPCAYTHTCSHSHTQVSATTL